MGIVLACSLVAGALAGGEGDLVLLKSGKALHGRIVFEDANSIVLRQDTRDSILARDEVEKVEWRTTWLSKLLDEATLLGDPSTTEFEVLATEAQAHGLEGEARIFWWSTLLIDSRHEAANRALGHRKRGEGWGLPVGGRTLDWEKRFELAKDWGSAWEFDSLHYHVRSNLTLRETLDVVLDLERLYRAFYELFGAELRLYDVVRPMSVFLHGDASSYPESANEFGRYEPETDIVQVNCANGLKWETLAHELTHQLLYDTVFRERDDSGEIPAWLGEGLAEYIAGSVPTIRPLTFEPGRLTARHFQAQARAKNPLDLTRVLALSTGDYQASSDRDLKYAQSYTLVHFLLHCEERKYREGFLEFLRSLYQGKGSVTDLKRCLKSDWRKLGASWQAYVKAHAG